MGRLMAALLASLLLAAPGFAQDSELDRVESLIANGDYAAARAAIEQWWKAVDGGRNVSSDMRARAHLLRARLAPDLRSAERDYLAVALGHPTTPYAPHALLALGQGFLASGDRARAVSYLQRLIDDYPGSPLRPVGLLWVARTRRLEGDAAGACVAARAGHAGAGPDVAALLRREEQAACQPAEQGHAAPRGQDQSAARDAGRTPQTQRPAATQGRFAVQSGAFRQVDGARALADRLRSAGYEPRIVLVSGSRLLRVRVGRFLSAADAESVASRLRSAGFPAVVVNDAHQEQQPR